MQIKDLLKAGNEFLGDRVTTSLDCEVLLAHVLGSSREYLFSHDDEEVQPNLVELFQSYLKRIADGEPIAYITNLKEFYGLDFFVDKRVLIPRPETEEIVKKALDYLNEKSINGGSFRVLDVGTGSGNIAIAIAKGFVDDLAEIEVTALEYDYDALDVARLNAGSHGVEERVNFFQSDLLEVLDDGEKFDVIVANLPYIGEVTHHYVSADTEKHEPHVALFGGENGLVLYERMFKEIIEKNIGFDLMMGEFGFAQAEDMAALLSLFFGNQWEIIKDDAGIERIFVIMQ